MAIVPARVNLYKRHSPAQHTARYDAAIAALCRIYCDVIELWRTCRKKSCKRHRRCGGEAWPCLQRGLPHVPRSQHPLILAQVRGGGPRRVAPVNDIERELRAQPRGLLT